MKIYTNHPKVITMNHERYVLNKSVHIEKHVENFFKYVWNYKTFAFPVGNMNFSNNVLLIKNSLLPICKNQLIENEIKKADYNCKSPDFAIRYLIILGISVEYIERNRIHSPYMKVTIRRTCIVRTGYMEWNVDVFLSIEWNVSHINICNFSFFITTYVWWWHYIYMTVQTINFFEIL